MTARVDELNRLIAHKAQSDLQLKKLQADYRAELASWCVSISRREALKTAIDQERENFERLSKAIKRIHESITGRRQADVAPRLLGQSVGKDLSNSDSSPGAA